MASNSVSVRSATVDDCEILLSLVRGLAEYEKLSHAVSATEEGFKRHLFGPERAAEAIIAVDGRTPVGFALFFTTFSTFVGKPGIYLEDLFVKPDARGTGIGGLLFKHVAKLAVDRDCGRLEWSVLNWNEPAIRFYEAQGAKPLDEWTMYRLTGDALVSAATRT
jgi:GNAT superfamily N-acetyltransferase